MIYRRKGNTFHFEDLFAENAQEIGETFHEVI